ncbi:hypothetical protein GCM10009624_19350 [Gordonia sinesedis]
MSDKQLAEVLGHAVAVIDPILDVLAERDPLGLKSHTFDEGGHDSHLVKAQHALATIVNVTDWPGTKGWSELSTDQRADWWVTRIGSLNTLAVAYPGIFGAWAKRLPISTTLGFANQAMVLVAIAREYGVTDPADQVRMLASVLCGRNLPAKAAPENVAAAPVKPGRSLFRAIWQVATILRDLTGELGRRPQPARPFSLLSYVPVIGAPALYIGERLALGRAAKEGRAWIADHSDATSVSPQRRAGTRRPRA